MAQDWITVKKVRLAHPFITPKGVHIVEWNARFVEDLKYYPKLHTATCRIDGLLHGASTAGFTCAPEEEQAWVEFVSGKTYECPDCGKPFTSPQSLGLHQFWKHPKDEQVQAEVLRIREEKIKKQAALRKKCSTRRGTSKQQRMDQDTAEQLIR